MNMFKFAFRNVFRNRKRSFLTGLSIFIAAITVATSEGWVRGTMDNFWNGYVKYQTGDVRITTKEFYGRERFLPVDELVPGTENILKKTEALPDVVMTEERMRFGILLSKGDQTVAAVGEGIDLKNSRLDIGRYVVESQHGQDGIYIGTLLAEKLGVKTGDRLLLATKTSEGGLNGIKLPIEGIFRFGVTMMDRDFFFISLSNAKRLLKTDRDVTEIFVFTRKHEMAAMVAKNIRTYLPQGVQAMTYAEQLGSLYDLMNMTENMMIFIEALILFLASFVVINTMMMAVFERYPEIGTLKALGMTDRQVFVNFILEGAIIGTMGGTAGAVAGYLLVVLFSITGVDISVLMDNVDIPMNNVIYPSANVIVLVITIVLSIIVTALSASVSAFRAKSLTPVEALKKA